MECHDPSLHSLALSVGQGVSHNRFTMTVQTDITSDDWTAFLRFVNRSVLSHPQDRMRRLLLIPALGLVVGVLSAATGINLHFPSLLIGAFISLAWFVVIARMQVRRMAPYADGFILGPREVRLTDEGLRESSELHDSLFRWMAIHDVKLTDQHVFVMMDRCAAVIVPRRAFRSDDECEEFVEEILTRSEDAT